MWYKQSQNANTGYQKQTTIDDVLNPPKAQPAQPQQPNNGYGTLPNPLKPPKPLFPTPKLMSATGYCPCAKCCGTAGGKTAAGTVPRQGRTVAVPPSIPLGTKISIAGMGNYIAEDRGGAIKGNHIDIFFNDHQDAINFGRRNVKVYLPQDTVIT